MLPAARPVPIAPRSTNLQVISGLALVTGWSFRESTGAAPAAFNLFDGTSNGGTLIAAITLITNESTRDLIPEPFVASMSGLFLEVTAGSVTGSVWMIAATLSDGYAFADGARGVWSGEQ